MTHLHGITVKYMSPTDTKGARVKLTSFRFNEVKFIPYDYALSSIAEMAKNYLESKGLEIVSFCLTESGFVLNSPTFKSIKR